jgi:L-alanine-DL-glutamate epimerase-like enolase superfamily enzyme
MKIVRLQAAECRIPLPRPIKLGPVEIKTRDFVVLRLVTDTGLFGDAVGYPRGTPLLSAVEALASRFLGQGVALRQGAVEAAQSALVNGRPAMVRAISLFDIALHDIMAKHCQLPLYQLLGGVRTQLPVMAVAGYYLNERGIEDVAQEVARLADQGFARIKIMLNGSDPDFDARFVERCMREAPGRLCADAHWSWRTLAEAMRTCRRLDDFGLLFLEDPFGAHQNSLVPRLQAELKTPLTCGEDMPDAASLLALADHVQMLRVDATTCGGIAAASTVIAAAALKGCAALPHVFAPLHAQLAAAHSSVEVVEIIPDTSADPLHLLLRRQPTLLDGKMVVDEAPGAGVDLDWEAVTRHAVQSVDLQESH